jgi:hypothetical protein
MVPTTSHGCLDGSIAATMRWMVVVVVDADQFRLVKQLAAEESR